jgi:1,4-dihydroxy-2-naphthoate octaprenyltransferase
VWGLASRPKTLFAALSPVMLGTAFACSEGRGHMGAAFAALLGAVGIQIGTNLANDYWDAKKGADGRERLGPVRVTSTGLLRPKTVFSGMVLVFSIAAVAGLYLALRAGWPVVAIGLTSIACGILYTAGPVSLAYVGLGDIFTFVFFGLVATAGTYFVQALAFSGTAVVLGCVPGFYSVVLLALNNLRDREQDLVAEKKTLAVRLGAGFARGEVVCCLFAPLVVPLWMAWAGILAWWMAVVAVAVCLATGWRVAWPACRIRNMREINSLFPRTGLAGVATALVLSVFLLLGPRG